MLDKYAENIGLAFQIVDDILDIEGDASIIGKPVGSDVANNKMTFPGIIGLEQSKKYAKDLIDDAIAKLKIFGHQALPLHEIANYIIKRNY
jgi:geranylgeranyl diphosphate synthase type II